MGTWIEQCGNGKEVRDFMWSVCETDENRHIVYKGVFLPFCYMQAKTA